MTQPKKLNPFHTRILQILSEARSNVVRSVNSEMVRAYWLIGQEIVEEEQRGKSRASYGEELIEHLSKRLNAEFGKGFTSGNLRYMRLFYLTYPQLIGRKIRHAVSDKSSEKQPLGTLNPNLSWTHYRLLTKVSQPQARAFYEVEAAKHYWSSRELERQISSLLFERLAKSRDKKGVMKLALRGHEVEKPQDAIKDPFILEFLDLPESHRLSESKLEEALIANLQHFLLELGKGFAFIARQKRITLEGDHFYIDLVFYHTILKCYVLIDLKVGTLTHNDLGQMQLYVNYFNKECIQKNDQPTLGLILCANKNDTMVRYTLGEDNKNVFASRYKTYLPTEKELIKELQKEHKEIESELSEKR